MTVVFEEHLPGDYQFGQVIGRCIEAVGDLTALDDQYPDAKPVTGSGKITFRPIELYRRVPGTAGEPTVDVRHRAIVADLDSAGYLSRNGTRGLWLWTGVWEVEFDKSLGATAFPIEVTTSHTASAPLDLFAQQPFVPPVTAQPLTLLVPAGGNVGDVLVKSGLGMLSWAAPATSDRLTPVTSNTTPAAGTTVGQLVGYVNTGSSTITVAGVSVPAGQSVILMWDGSSWKQPTIAGGGAATAPAPDPSDTTPPIPGTLSVSGTTDTTVSLVVSGASDDKALAAAPYQFSTDGGSTWSAAQSSPLFTKTGLTQNTTYSCKVQVSDAAGNTATATTTATTQATVAAVTPVYRSGTFNTSLVTATTTAPATYTTSSVDLGTPTTTRTVWVIFGWYSNQSVNGGDISIKVGGVSLTQQKVLNAQSVNTLEVARKIVVFSGNVPSGSTADVVATITKDATIERSLVWVWTTEQATVPKAVVSAGAFTTTPVSISTTVPAGQGLLLGWFDTNATGNPAGHAATRVGAATTWTDGALEATSGAFDATITPAGTYHYGAYAAFTVGAA